MQLAPWGGRRNKLAKLTRDQAEDVIRNCREPAQDALFAARFGVSAEAIRRIRTGHGWAWVREEIRGAKI